MNVYANSKSGMVDLTRLETASLLQNFQKQILRTFDQSCQEPIANHQLRSHSLPHSAPACEAKVNISDISAARIGYSDFLGSVSVFHGDLCGLIKISVGHAVSGIKRTNFTVSAMSSGCIINSRFIRPGLTCGVFVKPG